MIDAHGWVSVVELIVYVPALIAAITICIRHGFKRRAGWIFTLILCILRIVGAICQLITYKNPSIGLIEATLIIDSIGLSPLLLATLGLLSRLIDVINARATSLFTVKHLRLIQVLLTVAIILSIVGGTTASPQPDGTISVEATSKAGIILYIVSYCAIVLVCLVSTPNASYIPTLERRVLVAVMVALPFILVRLVYSACTTFLHDHMFNLITGSIGVRVAMAVVEEFIVVAIYILLGFTVDKYDLPEKEPIVPGLLNRIKGKEGRKHNKGYTVPQENGQELHYGGQQTV